MLLALYWVMPVRLKSLRLDDRELLPIEGGMIHTDTALAHHFLKLPIRNGIGHILPDAPQAELPSNWLPLKSIMPPLLRLTISRVA